MPVRRARSIALSLAATRAESAAEELSAPTSLCQPAARRTLSPVMHAGRNYPSAPRLDTVDDLHGRRVPDPYRWLEDPASPQTSAWSEAQDRVCRDFLDAPPGREHRRRRYR